MEFTVIAAVDDELGIGIVNSEHPAGRIPWDDARDRRYFADITKHVKNATSRNAVIMGRRTWESLPIHPLPRRLNIVVSRQVQPYATCTSLDAALKRCVAEHAESVFVIGGAELYAEALRHPLCVGIILSHINGVHGCNVVFPRHRATLAHRLPIAGLNVSFWRFDNAEERAYLKLLEALSQGPVRPNRTGVNTRGRFMETLRFSLTNADGASVLPIMTTKHVPFRVVAEELLWFIRGESTVDSLREQRVGIWDGNTSREFLDGRGLVDYREGELGTGYPWQWRHFGAKYIPVNQRQPGYSPGGVDQLARVIDSIKRDPYGRRHVVSAWNPADLHNVSLPPCHVLFEFYVSESTLSCHMHMRSADAFLGVPFNIVSYSLLTHMVAMLTGYRAHEFVISMADCHLYENHIDAAAVQTQRTPRRFPTIEIKPAADIDGFTIDSFKVVNYYPHAKISAEMAV